MRYLLDTDTCIAVMRNEPKAVARMATAAPFECAVSTITAYELYTGVAKCADPVREAGKISKLLKAILLLAFDIASATQAAKIRATLESQGNSIGPYDILLAGHALSAQLTLVTSNTREFSRVDGLVLENWRF